MEEPSTGELVVLGEIAHIVAERPDGPRGDDPMSLEDRNRYANLMLLCQEHHQLVDSQPGPYSKERLRAMKEAHEAWVDEQLGRGAEKLVISAPRSTDPLYSTLLDVERMPKYLFSAPTGARFPHEVVPEFSPGFVTPFVLHGERLIAFQNLRDEAGPFATHVDRSDVERSELEELLGDPDRERLVQQLLNRSLNKLTGHRGLLLDKEHHRYYFPVEQPGTKRSISYRPLNNPSATRSVVWQPTKRADGSTRNYWLHRAVNLGFVLLQRSPPRWALSIRPELHISADGVNAYPSKAVGRRVTRRKSRLFNYDLLGELQFWRDFLSESKARIVLRFTDNQLLVVSTALVESTISWPGIPAEYARPFQNVYFVDDLLTWAEANPLTPPEDPDDWDESIDDLEE